MLTLFHGSRSCVEKPCIEKCRDNNDYGKGFYCTLHPDLAKEWACQLGLDGFCNKYRLDDAGLTVVDLNSPPFNLLNWLAVLFENRVFHLTTPTMERGARWLLDNYAVDLSGADVVKGYRADDSYFSFARSFLRNEITVAQLQAAMKLGDLGEQYMVKSPKAFNALEFVGCEAADSATYWPRRSKRDGDARDAYRKIVESDPAGDQLYLSALMRMGKEEADALLQ